MPAAIPIDFLWLIYGRSGAIKLTANVVGRSAGGGQPVFNDQKANGQNTQSSFPAQWSKLGHTLVPPLVDESDFFARFGGLGPKLWCCSKCSIAKFYASNRWKCWKMLENAVRTATCSAVCLLCACSLHFSARFNVLIDRQPPLALISLNWVGSGWVFPFSDFSVVIFFWQFAFPPLIPLRFAFHSFSRRFPFWDPPTPFLRGIWFSTTSFSL